jgi:hypothetical protein
MEGNSQSIWNKTSEERMLVLEKFDRATMPKEFSLFTLNLNTFKSLIQNITTSGEPLILFDDLVNSTKASFAALESLRVRNWIQIRN